MTERIYLDYNASTPIAAEVAEAMRPFLSEDYGNPSGLHWAGLPAKAAVERARGQVASLLGAAPQEIVFTSGGSESNNYAIKGTFFANRSHGEHVITTAIEHPSVSEPCKFLEGLGGKVTYLPVDGYGLVDPEAVRRALTARTVLISVMHANNEVGTIEPIAEIGRLARERGILFHTDAAQTLGKVPARVDELNVDLLTMAGHKLYGPKGVGALYVRSGSLVGSFVHGASHESGRRAGTENVLGVVGLGAACELAGEWVGKSGMRELRDRFWEELRGAFGERVSLNGHPELRLPNTLSVNFIGRIGAEILEGLEGVAASTGSACHAGSVELSGVLKAMGVSPEHGMGTIRFSLGRSTSAEQIDRVVAALGKLLG